MTQTAQPPVDPVFAGIAKALYGDVDPREVLAKFSPGGSDLHMDGPVDPKKQAAREKKLAAIGMGSTAVAGVGGLHALSATRKEILHSFADKGSEKAAAKLKTINDKAATKTAARAARVASAKGPTGKVLRTIAAHPRQAAAAAGAGWVGLHGVELAADSLAMRANAKAYRNAQRKQQGVSKAFRLKPLNVVGAKLPSLRAKRPAANPLPKTPTAQGALFKPVVKKSAAVVIIAKAGKHAWEPINVAPVTGSTFNSNTGQGAGNLGGQQAYQGKHRAQPGATPPPQPGATSPPKPNATPPTPKPGGTPAGVDGTAPKAGRLIPKLKKLGKPGLIAGGLVGAGVAGAAVGGRRKNDDLSKGVIGGVRRTVTNAEKATGHASNAAREAAEATAKINDLIPSKKTLKRVALGTAGVGSFGVGGAYGAGRAAGQKKERRRQARQERPILVPSSVTKSVTWTGAIAKVDADKRQVFGWASVSAINGEQVIDLQGDIVPIEETEKAAYRYVMESRKGGDMHRRVAKAADEPLHTADLIESFVVTGEKLEKMGLAPNSLPHGWWVGFKVNDDEQWGLVKSGHRAGFSIHGAGVRTPAGISKADAPKVLKLLPGKHRGLAEASASGVGQHRAAEDRNNWRKIQRIGERSAQWVPAGPKHLAKADRRFKTEGGQHRQEKTLARAKADPWVVPLHAKKRSAADKVKLKMIAHGGLINRVVDYTPNVLQTVGTQVYPLLKADRPVDNIKETLHDTKDVLSDAKRSAGKKVRRIKGSLKTRTDQALHPPSVKLKPVDSSAVSQMGYQPQTRRLAYQLRSNPGTQYTYKVPVTEGVSALSAESKGRHYATKVARKAKRSDKVTPVDRARLFIKPDVSKALKPAGTPAGKSSAPSGARPGAPTGSIGKARTP